MDDTSPAELEPWDPPRGCTMCGHPPSEIEAFGDLQAICGECMHLFMEYMCEHSSPTGVNGSNSPFIDGDSDASVNDNSFLDNPVPATPESQSSINDDEFEELETNENTLGRIQLHRSLATNGRNLQDDWLNEILQEITGEYPAAVSFVKNLKPVVVDDSESDAGLVCVICLDAVGGGTVVNRLPCRHVFHPACIVSWLSARNTCPLCRYKVPTDDKDYEGSHETQMQDVEDDDGRDGSGGGRWWCVVGPMMSMVGIGLVVVCGGGVIGGSWASQRGDRSSGWWWFS